MKNINRQRMLTGILIELSYRLKQFEAKGFKPIREDWLAYHVHHGMQMNFLYQGETCVGRAVGLNDNGALLFESGGEIIAVNSGAVSSLRATA
jgi:BirA family biotin operon repressor/biotin-[acetyl-CoA-carboxylase] ligase